MLKYYEGTVFNSECDAFVNTVNCSGIMGAGIALEFKLRYPDMFEDYKVKCQKKIIQIGQVDYYRLNAGKIIINFPTKFHYKYPSKINWIEQGLKDFVKTHKNHDFKSVAFPKLGTNKGGLEWDNVKYLMEKYLSKLMIDVIICLDKQKAQGIEKIMLDEFNSINILELGDVVKLTAAQKDTIQENKPYSRFWKINESKTIGIKTYTKIFEYFYDIAKNGVQENVQMSLFDKQYEQGNI